MLDFDHKPLQGPLHLRAIMATTSTSTVKILDRWARQAMMLNPSRRQRASFRTIFTEYKVSPLLLIHNTNTTITNINQSHLRTRRA
ncbi:hypothetical protein BGZ73_008311 [Actinomortierella ambigua]|nr:hypothetical protein BGZ73_008311 [Actinomortierella ambigua]